MTQTFTRMDESTAEQWGQIGVESAKSQQHQGETVLALLQMLSTKVDGFAVDQHSARPAGPLVAPLLGAGQLKVVAQQVEKRCAEIERRFHAVSIDVELHGLSLTDRSLRLAAMVYSFSSIAEIDTNIVSNRPLR